MMHQIQYHHMLYQLQCQNVASFSMSLRDIGSTVNMLHQFDCQHVISVQFHVTAGGPGTKDVWVGGVEANMAEENGEFVWDRSREPILSSLWADGQPYDFGSANGNQDHVELWLTTAGLNDEMGSALQFYLCEADMF